MSIKSRFADKVQATFITSIGFGGVNEGVFDQSVFGSEPLETRDTFEALFFRVQLLMSGQVHGIGKVWNNKTKVKKSWLNLFGWPSCLSLLSQS